MNKTVDSLSIWLETIAVFVVSTFIAFFAFLYAILYLGLWFIPILPVINFDQIASASIYAFPVGALIAIFYYRFRRH